MKNWEDIETLCQNTIFPSLNQMEEDRRGNINLFLIISAAETIIAIPCYILLLPHSCPDPFTNTLYVVMYSIGFILAYMVALYVPYMLCRGNMRKAYESLVLAQMVPFIDPGLKFDATGFISQDVLIQSKIFSMVPNSCSGYNQVSGTYQGVNLRFSNVFSSSGSGKYTSIVFNGIFFCAEFPKKSQSVTIVLPAAFDEAFMARGSLFELIGGNVQKVVLEDPEFIKEFVVYGQDQIQARYLLSLSFMQRLVAFKRKIKKNVSLSFVGGNLYIAVECDDVYGLEWQSFLSLERIRRYYDHIELYLGIVEDLKLNEKIWA